MMEPGKQHNFRVLRDATWTDDFNRLLAVSGLSTNKLINYLIQTGLATFDVTGEKQRLAFVTSEELEHLIARRLSPENLQGIESKPVPKAVPVATPKKEVYVEEAPTESEPEVDEKPTRRPAINKGRNKRPSVAVPDDVKDSFNQFKAD